MLVQLPRGHFTATRSVADSPAALVRQPSLPALKRWPAPSEVDDEPSAALIDQEAVTGPMSIGGPSSTVVLVKVCITVVTMSSRSR